MEPVSRLGNGHATCDPRHWQHCERRQQSCRTPCMTSRAECVMIISLAFWRGPLRDEKLFWTDLFGDWRRLRHFDWRVEGAARGAAYAGAKRSTSADGEGTRVGCRHRTKVDGADAGRRTISDGYLQAEECQRAGADYLGAHALQL